MSVQTGLLTLMVSSSFAVMYILSSIWKKSPGKAILNQRNFKPWLPGSIRGSEMSYYFSSWLLFHHEPSLHKYTNRYYVFRHFRMAMSCSHLLSPPVCGILNVSAFNIQEFNYGPLSKTLLSLRFGELFTRLELSE